MGAGASPSVDPQVRARAEELASRYPLARPALDLYLDRAAARPARDCQPVPASAAAPDTAVCPRCGHKPVAAVLREAGYGAKRSLVCSRCPTEWAFERIRCPNCAEQRDSQLAVYTAEQFECVRLDVCLTCKTYIKTVDLTKNGLAVPEVDEVASLALDLWAQEQGYRKLETNLLGY